MCTVTVIARADGYTLGMNRDEKQTRAIALPPTRRPLGQRDTLFPSEPGGGTWIGVNDTGLSFALVNWYSIPHLGADPMVSRGQVVLRALALGSIREVEAALGTLPLDRMNPFRLIGVSAFPGVVSEWRWNLRRLERFDHPWQTATWISSGVDESGAQTARGKTFHEALRQSSAGTPDWLRRLHRSHRPERGPYSTCMHREDAATVSYTEVRVTRHAAQLKYTPGAPCCTKPTTTLALSLQRR